MNIRQLKKTDYKDYITLISGFRPIGEEVSENKFNEIYDQIFKTNVILVCEDKGNLIASITIVFEQKFIHHFSIYARIEDVYVSESRQGEGLGKLMVKKALELCKERGCFKVVLSCKDTLSKFYAKNGFEKRDINMSQLV